MMEWNGSEFGKKIANENLKETIPNTDYDRLETT
jgi:hypothetical protein